MKYSSILLIFVFGLSTYGCQTTPKVEMLPRSVSSLGTPAEFTNLLLAERVAKGYTIKQQTANLLVIERPANDVASQLVFGSDFNSVPNARLTYQFVGSDPMTVTVSGSVVTNPGSGFERPTDMNGHQSMNDVVLEMRRIAQDLERRKLAESAPAVEG